MATKTLKPIPIVKHADGKGRITLGGRFINRTVLLEETPDGDVLIRLAEVVPDRESWLYKNPKALAMVLKGIEQARKRQFVKGPDLEKARRIAAQIPDETE
jgi:hypothetical protein